MTWILRKKRGRSGGGERRGGRREKEKEKKEEEGEEKERRWRIGNWLMETAAAAVIAKIYQSFIARKCIFGYI